jgi:dynein intermediate chain 2
LYRYATESLQLKEKNGETIYGAMSMEYEAIAGPTKFMIGTEQGTVLMCNRKAKNPSDRIGTAYHGHHGPVYSLERNPFFPKYFMSIGDWSARVWMEDLKTPIMTTRYHGTHLTGGTWSPTRPGVFFTIKMDGELDVWDYYYKQNDPTLSVKVTDKALTSFNIQDSGRLVTVGASDGSATLMELCEGLATMQPNEKASINQMFERETKREKNLEARAKELKNLAKKKAQNNDDGDGGDSEEAMAEVEQEFMSLTVKSGMKFDNVSPLDMELPEGANMDM